MGESGRKWLEVVETNVYNWRADHSPSRYTRPLALPFWQLALTFFLRANVSIVYVPACLEVETEVFRCPCAFVLLSVEVTVK